MSPKNSTLLPGDAIEISQTGIGVDLSLIENPSF